MSLRGHRCRRRRVRCCRRSRLAKRTQSATTALLLLDFVDFGLWRRPRQLRVVVVEGDCFQTFRHKCVWTHRLRGRRLRRRGDNSLQCKTKMQQKFKKHTGVLKHSTRCTAAVLASAKSISHCVIDCRQRIHVLRRIV